MNNFKFASVALSALAAVSVMAQANQPPKPSGPNGEPFWFGPGPAMHKAVGTAVMTTQDRAWFEWDSCSGGWSGANTLGSYAGTNYAISYIAVPTTVNVKPYVYVDGYFGLAADVCGYGTNFNIDLGFSRFYVLHNTPVFLRFTGFTNATLQSIPAGTYGSNTVNLDYRCEVRAWMPNGIAGGIVRSFTFGPLSTPLGQTYLDPRYDTDFFAQVDIFRKASVYWNNPAGTYQATGVLSVSNY